MQQVEDYLQRNRQRFEEDLLALLRIPSVSAVGAHRDDVQQAARWMVGQFESIGLTAELIETDGHPLVFAQSPEVSGAPTALVYGHYDVQPADPLEQWITPPFEPTVREGNVYARGATDDKGQMLTHVKSAEAWMKSVGHLPINVKYLIEGEEEVGSVSLAKYLAGHHERLACDCVVISDTSQFGPGQPAITYGLRGIAYHEIRLRGPNQDLHSGTFGGAVTNPAIALAQMLSELIDEEGRIQVPGFYDDVLPLTGDERQDLADLPFDEQAFARQLGVDALRGEAGFSTLERRWTRPSCDINGLTSGYQGEGAKTIIPCEASAKVSFRLVPRQDPAKIGAGLRRMIEELTPPGIKLEIIDHHGAPGFVVSRQSPYMQAAARAIEQGFGCQPVWIREGGSIPIVNQFQQHLNADVLLLGWGLNDDNTHSPNEKFCLADYQRGIRASCHLWQELASAATGG